ncbi:hypothetical protein PGH12_14695 [Chryseobacterium wangxinyae]|uniref:hypothetical protein n=1 Tax=Chryseobacterium sp. CY350 TaxID=2997336 RepID=UPI00226FC3A0|nr:hypothetical protein [Chryseobacterium sp. CY350]MCY0979133.1 hypothetical protein [Chryseobacterium sp. CY350]WBZ94707.1 hypothetical protein PGH12_14695 [Chryseobacterium sp. CY350]
MKKLVLSIALIGMGSFVMAQQVPQDKKVNREEMKQKMQQKEQERMAEMQKELNLNQSQIAQIKDLHEKRKSEMKNSFEKNKEQRQAKMEEMKAKRQQMDNDMKKILSPDQYDKWQAGKKAKMEQRRAMMKERGMKGDHKMRHGLKPAPQPQIN